MIRVPVVVVRNTRNAVGNKQNMIKTLINKIKDNQTTKIHGGGFLYNPNNKAVFLHLRDGNTKNNPYGWDFFGGSGHKGETPEECFLRELKEEIGVEFNREDIIPLRDHYIEKRNVHRYIYYIISDLDKKKVRLSEGASCDWILLDDVFRLNLGNGARHDLQLFVDKLKEK